MRSSDVLLLIALCTRAGAYRLNSTPRTPSTVASCSRFESPRHHHDSSCPTSSRRGSNLGDKIDNAAASRTRRTIATSLATLRRKSGMAMPIFSNCLDYARERPQLVAGALCASAATASFLGRCGGLPRRLEAPFIMVSSALCNTPGRGYSSFILVQRTTAVHKHNSATARITWIATLSQFTSVYLCCNIHKKKGKGQRGYYSPGVFKRNGGIGKTRPRNALPRAPACFKFNSGALTFFRARCWGERHRRAEGVKRIRPLLTTWGDMPPQLNLLYVVPPCDQCIPPLDRNRTRS